MSKIALTPNASGSGTFTIASPNSDTDRVLTLPDEAGTILTTTGDGSSLTGIAINAGKHRFFARRPTDQAVANNTYDRIVFDSEIYDVSNAYNASTGQYSVPEDGVYFFYASAKHASSGNTNLWNGRMNIRVDTSIQTSHLFNYAANYPNEVTHNVSAVLSCTANQLVDVNSYIETSSGSGSKFGGGEFTYFMGFRLA